MANITLPTTLTNGTTADATQVMGNFNAIVNEYNSSVGALSGDILTTTNTKTLTNKTLTSPKINEDVAVTSTATEINLLDGLADVVSSVNTKTLTSKTIIATSNVIAEITTATDSATPTPTGGSLRNEYSLTALAQAAAFAAPSGSPVNWNSLIIRVKDAGTAKGLSFDGVYRFSTDLVAPTTTVLGKTLYMAFVYNSADSKWDCVAILNNL